jgi:hypothetical protein
VLRRWRICTTVSIFEWPALAVGEQKDLGCRLRVMPQPGLQRAGSGGAYERDAVLSALAGTHKQPPDGGPPVFNQQV